MQKVKKSNPMKFTKSTIFLIILILWLVFSVAYMVVDNWQDFKMGYAENILLQGREEGATQAYNTVAQALVQQFEEGCKNPVPLNLGKDEDGKDMVIGLVNAACFQEQEGEQPISEEE